jgi:hypothetical protein
MQYLLFFYCNNGCTKAPQCYVIHTFSVLLFLGVVGVEVFFQLHKKSASILLFRIVLLSSVNQMSWQSSIISSLNSCSKCTGRSHQIQTILILCSPNDYYKSYFFQRISKFGNKKQPLECVGRNSVVSTAGQSGGRMTVGRDFSHTSSPDLRPTQPPVHWVPALFPGVRRPIRGVDNTPHLALRLKNKWIYTSTPPMGL